MMWIGQALSGVLAASLAMLRGTGKMHTANAAIAIREITNLKNRVEPRIVRDFVTMLAFSGIMAGDVSTITKELEQALLLPP